MQIEKLVQDIINLVNKNQSDFTNKILHITIKEITNHTGDNPIPKITYHEQPGNL
jgi:hypothetical protein